MRVDLKSLKIDTDWQVQGRVIPPSCTQGSGCMLHLQVKNTKWPIEHFHIGRSKIPADVAVDIIAAQLTPYEETQVLLSYDSQERAHDIEYLNIDKVQSPEDTLLFTTTNGLVFLIQIDGLNVMFGYAEKCKHCNTTVQPPLFNLDDDSKLDDLMLVRNNEYNH